MDNFSDLKKVCIARKMGGCWATFVSFEAELELKLDGIFVENSALSWVCRDSSKPHRPAGERWVLHATPGWTSEHLDDDAETIATQLISELFRVTSLPHAPSKFRKSHRWLYAIPVDTKEGDEGGDKPTILQTGTLAICGDWCHSGRVEGAYLSGQQAASAILAALV